MLWHIRKYKNKYSAAATCCRALLDLPPPRYFVLPYYADKLKQLLDINVAIQDGQPLQYEIVQLQVSSRIVSSRITSGRISSSRISSSRIVSSRIVSGRISSSRIVSSRIVSRGLPGKDIHLDTLRARVDLHLKVALIVLLSSDNGQGPAYLAWTAFPEAVGPLTGTLWTCADVSLSWQHCTYIRCMPAANKVSLTQPRSPQAFVDEAQC